jgi:hypothetical protein
LSQDVIVNSEGDAVQKVFVLFFFDFEVHDGRRAGSRRERSLSVYTVLMTLVIFILI